MKNSQELFEINKRINQIKRNLQSRQQKAQQWSVPYQKILQKPMMNQTCQSYFRNTHNGKFTSSEDPMIATFSTNTERKQFFANKAKQSRKKINEFHNQLKQLHELLDRKTKLHVKKQCAQNLYDEKQQGTKYDKKYLSLSPQTKIMSKSFTNSMIMSGNLGRSSLKAPVRTWKDRVNPFLGVKAQKIIQLYQQAKHSGKQNIIHNSLGMGIEFTPYSSLKKEIRRDEDLDMRITFLQNSSFVLKQKNTTKSDNELIDSVDDRKYGNTLIKGFETKLREKQHVYLEEQRSKQTTVPSIMKKKTNVFETRLKKLLHEAQAIESSEGNYIQMLKKRKNHQNKGLFKSSIGKIRANHTYQTVFA